MQNITLTAKQIAIIKDALEQCEADLPRDDSSNETYDLISDIYEKLDQLELISEIS